MDKQTIQFRVDAKQFADEIERERDELLRFAHEQCCAMYAKCVKGKGGKTPVICLVSLQRAANYLLIDLCNQYISRTDFIFRMFPVLCNRYFGWERGHFDMHAKISIGYILNAWRSLHHDITPADVTLTATIISNLFEALVNRTLRFGLEYATREGGEE